MKILICDDAGFIRELLKTYFESLGKVEIFEATQGEQALELVKILDLDLVFLDIVLPKMGGVEAAKLIKNEKPDIFICSLSSLEKNVFDQQDNIFDAHLEKPFRVEDIASLLGSYLNQKKHVKGA